MTIDYGKPTPTIAQQLREQKINYDSQFIKGCEKARQSIANLKWYELITSKDEQLYLRRLNTTIKNHIYQTQQKRK